VAGNKYSLTWTLSPQELSDAVTELRVWARDRFGRLDEYTDTEYDLLWHVYDLAG
jgi:hypothetical protein